VIAVDPVHEEPKERKVEYPVLEHQVEREMLELPGRQEHPDVTVCSLYANAFNAAMKMKINKIAF